MVQFNYIVKDMVGMHARPAGAIAMKSKEYESEMMIYFAGKSAPLKKVIEVMSMGIGNGDEITISVEVVDEEKAAKEMLEFIEQNL